jgi:hypothetical protein
VVICFFYFSILELPKKKYNKTQNGAELATTINWKPMTSSLECEKKAPQNMSNTITTEQQIFKCLCVVSNGMSSSYVVQENVVDIFLLFLLRPFIR